MNRTLLVLCHNLRLLLSLFCVAVSSIVYAVDPYRLPNHYIVAFDPYVAIYQSYYTDASVLDKVNKDLKAHGYDPSIDYISVIGYALEMGYPNMDRFARPYTTNTRETWKWNVAGDATLKSTFNPWPLGQPTLENGPAASAQVLAKPFVIKSVGQESNDSTRHLADHTYLVMVTDDVSNGGHNDYAKEWANISTAGGANPSRFRQIQTEVFSQMQEFNNMFKFEVPKQKAETAISPNGGYKMLWHELIPSDRPSIHSATSLPSPLPLQRVRGGYKLDLDVKPVSELYEINRFDIISAKGDTLVSSPTAMGSFKIPSDKLNNGDSIDVKMHLAFKDGIYNGVVMSPDNPRYAAGLSNRQKVKLADEAKVMGLFPLTDSLWWWFPNDIFTAVMIWDVIILLLGIIIIGYILYRWFIHINTYHPTDNNLKIRKI